MSYQSKLRKALLDSPAVTAIVGQRIYMLHAPQGNSRETFILLSVVNHERMNHLTGSSDLEHARVRFDFFGESYTELMTLADAVRTALTGTTDFTAQYIFGFDMYDDDVRFFHHVSDWSVWHG